MVVLYVYNTTDGNQPDRGVSVSLNDEALDHLIAAIDNSLPAGAATAPLNILRNALARRLAKHRGSFGRKSDGKPYRGRRQGDST